MRSGLAIGCTAAAVAASLLCTGCASDGGAAARPPGPDAAVRTQERPSPAGAAASGGDSTPVATYIDARPVALVDGRGVTWGDLRPILAEMDGAAALNEVILDRRLAANLLEARITITEDDARREQRLMLESLSPDGDTAVRLLNTLRARQGLGRARFNALLRRNAGLRALVQDEIAISAAAVEHEHRVRYGPRRQARIIVVPSLGDAGAAIDAIEGGAAFVDVAVERSTDASAARGGLLEPISRDDAIYPEALRRALYALEPGDLSPPVLLDGQYAILQLHGEIPAADVPLADVEQDLRRLVRLQEERRAMDQLARALLNSATVTIFDESLRESRRLERME